MGVPDERRLPVFMHGATPKHTRKFFLRMESAKEKKKKVEMKEKVPISYITTSNFSFSTNAVTSGLILIRRFPRS